MNLLLLEESDFCGECEVEVFGNRARHLIGVLQVSLGQVVRAGLVNGFIGSAEVVDIAPTEARVRLTVDLHSKPPEPASIELLSALPRPKMLRRMVRTAAELGIKRICFINSYKVEKSYWQSPNLQKLRDFCLEGLSQSGDTMMPEILIEKRFKPFVEDRLAEFIGPRHALLAHPRTGHSLLQWQAENDVPPGGAALQYTLVLGPEGGFTEYEATLLCEHGCTSVDLGQRILRCDTVLPYLCGTLA